MNTAFVMYGPPHLAALGVTLVTPLVLAALARRDRAIDPYVRWGLAALLLGGWIAWYV